MLFAICIMTSVFAREINLDELYIKHSSPYLKRLSLLMLDTYEKVDAVFVDRNVIYSAWLSGNYILYIKELSGKNNNAIYMHNIQKKQGEVLKIIPGVITYARVSRDGRYLFFKRLTGEKSEIPYGEICVLHLIDKRFSSFRTKHPFIDFSVNDSDGTMLIESEDGVVRYDPWTGKKTVVMKKNSYSDIATAENPTIGFYSPDESSFLIINGGGGNYRAKIFSRGKSNRLRGITASSELYWIDNFTFVYRSGSAGNYNVMIYNVNSGKKQYLLKYSLNTNITFSQHPRIITFLRDQVIVVYSMKDRQQLTTGLEGEDVAFDPSGRLFTSLKLKRLFIVNIFTLARKQMELRRCWKQILEIYESLKNNSHSFDNEFSEEYIDRKIKLYRSLLSD